MKKLTQLSKNENRKYKKGKKKRERKNALRSCLFASDI